MDLSERERKILWAKAGNRCSFRFQNSVCDQPLCINDQGKNVVVGQECHIVGEKPVAARFIDDFPARESYNNAILMCPIHHKLIDDKETRDIYTIEILIEMKRIHEQAIKTHENMVSSARLEIKDSEFSTEVNGADRAVGMEVNVPATLSNIKSELKAANVREAVGFSTNQGLTSMIYFCSACRNPFPAAFTGPLPASIQCPHCGQANSLKR